MANGTKQQVRTQRLPVKPKKPMKEKPMEKKQKNNLMKPMKKKPMQKKPTKGVVVATALTSTRKNEEKWVHVDSRNVKEIWVQINVVQNKALVKVWKKDD